MCGISFKGLNNNLPIKVKKIINFFIYLYYFLKNYNFIKHGTSYGQYEDDLFVYNYFKKDNGFYVDVGAYHPFRINNTYMLYKKGWRGINIDANQNSIDLFNFSRKRDLNLCAGVSDVNEKLKYYSKKNIHFNSTFDNQLISKKSGKYKSEIVNCKPLSEILDSTPYKNYHIDFLNIDAEGFDLKVLKGLDLKTRRPTLIIVELVNKETHKDNNKKIMEYLYNHSYILIKKNINAVFENALNNSKKIK